MPLISQTNPQKYIWTF